MQKTTHTNCIKGIGTDIIEIRRIKIAIEKHGKRFLDRLFTKHEQDYCHRYKNAVSHFAGRFAAKEAILKAFGTGLRAETDWKEIEITNNTLGKPEVSLSVQLKASLGIADILLSISHCKLYATAIVIVT